MRPTPIAATLALALTLSGSVAATMATAAPAGSSLTTATTTSADTSTLGSDQLTVEVANDFPRIVRYTHTATGARLGGQPNALTTVRIDGVNRTATVAAPRVEAAKAVWTLSFADLPGVQLDASVSVAGTVTTFAIDAVRDTEANRVNTIEIPDHDLVSVASTDAGAATAFTTLDPDATRTADRFAAVTSGTAAESTPVGATYAFVNTSGLAAGLVTNATVDKPTSAAADDGTRFWHRARAGADGTKRVGVWTGEWTYRGDTAPYTEPLPWTKVTITPDANADGTVDWQDGALAYRKVAPVAKGADEVPDRVIQRIPMNFASQATHPFLRTLDDTKRIAQATDGLGQFAVLKGYGSEGHDSAHPDYGGNYNTRAGGLKDLNTLLEQGEKWNAAYGVHVNATESYPEARAFSEDLVDKGSKGWNWLNQSYYMKQRPDLASGDIINRFKQLRDETHPNLEALYIDVYYQSGWLADSLSRQLGDQGWQITTEWADRFERSALWAHWSNDLSYGGQTNKGLNSQIIRFISNDRKDTWNSHPVLGQPALEDFEGWTGETDWNTFYTNVWTKNLPAKFAQQQQIVDWNGNDIRFAQDVRGTVENGKRTFYVGDAKVLDGDRYLLPWASKGKTSPDKLYHYNPAGGSTTWTLPGEFAKAPSVAVYELTDTGRKQVGTLTPQGGKVTIDAKAKQPYVLYPAAAPAAADPQWGFGTGVKDPGFNAANLSQWEVAGNAKVTKLPKGHHVAEVGAGQATLSQRVTGLTTGKTYSASAWVEIEPGKTRSATIKVAGNKGTPSASTIERSTLQNRVAADEKHTSYFQRVRTLFTARSNTVTLSMEFGSGDARVLVDDVRFVATAVPAKAGAQVFADFEDVDQGWWPFVKGDAGGTTDPRTSFIRKHAPYTQAGWNGKRVDDVLNGEWSLKAHEENQGLVYRTTPATVKLVPGHKYKVDFRYANGRVGQYQWVRGTDRIVDGAPRSTDLVATPVPEQLTPATWTEQFTAGCGGDNWVGLRKLSGGGDQADFIMDDFTVTDLGVSSDAPQCASTTIAGVGLGGMVPGEASPVTTSLLNNGTDPLTSATLSLTVPTGWTATASTPTTFATVAASQRVTTTWAVTPPTTATPGSYPLGARAAYTAGGLPGTAETTATATVLPPGTIPKSRMSIESVTSEDPGTDGGATKAIDGDPATHWHTAWSAVPTPDVYPHEVVIDLGAAYAVNGFAHLPRQVGTNGRMKDYRLYVSADTTSWGEPVSSGSFTIGADETKLDFTAKTGRYVRLVGLNAQNGGAFGGAAELGVFGTPAS